LNQFSSEQGAQAAQRHLVVELTRHQITIHSEMQDKKANGREECKILVCKHGDFSKESQEDNKEDDRKAEKKTEIITQFKRHKSTIREYQTQIKRSAKSSTQPKILTA
jgi:hypothetical protein